MTMRPFAKSSCGRIFIYFTVIIFITAALFITAGCGKSDYEKALSGEDITVDTQASDTEPSSKTLETQSGENTDTGSSSSTTSGTTEQATVSEATETNITDDNTLKFIEKSLNIKALGAFYSELNTWSMQLEINKETGEAEGFIFASYMEAALDGNSTEINTSVLKAALKGIVDMETLDFIGKATGNITADRDDYFSGSVGLDTTGKLSEDNSQFTGNFTTPSYVIFNFTLKNTTN